MVGVTKSDFQSADRDRRMWACAMRGDLTFEGIVLSNAFELCRHQPSLHRRRFFHHEANVRVASNIVRWDSLSADDQIEYIAGYAAGAAGVDGVPGAAHWWSGYQRGVAVAVEAKRLEGGATVDHVLVVAPEAVDRQLHLVAVGRDERLGFGFKGVVAAGQMRVVYSDNGSTVRPWSGGYHFETDAIV